MPMRKIYFAGSIRGGRADRERYAEIIRLLQDYGEVLTEHVGLGSLDAGGEEGMTDREIHDRDVAWLTTSDAVVAEVTTPSLGVGYEIARAALQRKPVLCLFQPEGGRRLSAMIAGCPGVAVQTYLTSKELPAILVSWFENLQ